MKVIYELGIKDLTVCASSLDNAHDYLVKCIEDCTVTGTSSSGVGDEIGEAISSGRSKAEVNAKYADNVIVITGTLVATPNFLASIKGVDVDYLYSQS